MLPGSNPPGAPDLSLERGCRGQGRSARRFLRGDHRRGQCGLRRGAAGLPEGPLAGSGLHGTGGKGGLRAGARGQSLRRASRCSRTRSRPRPRRRSPTSTSRSFTRSTSGRPRSRTQVCAAGARSRPVEPRLLHRRFRDRAGRPPAGRRLPRCSTAQAKQTSADPQYWLQLGDFYVKSFGERPVPADAIKKITAIYRQALALDGDNPATLAHVADFLARSATGKGGDPALPQGAQAQPGQSRAMGTTRLAAIRDSLAICYDSAGRTHGCHRDPAAAHQGQPAAVRVLRRRCATCMRKMATRRRRWTCASR